MPCTPRSRRGNHEGCPRLIGGLLLGALVAVVTIAAAACSADAEPTPTPSPPTTGENLRVALASTDIAVGRNRIAFGLIDPAAGAVRDARVQVSTFFLAQGGARTPEETAQAVYRKWPVGEAGVYTVEAVFDRPGRWGLGISTEVDGSPRKGSVSFEVAETSAAPAVGSPAPRSANKTAGEGGLDRLTTDPDPDPDLYAMTIAEASDSGRPSLVVFATPAYCTTSTCGPQLRVVKQLKREYSENVNFVHVEVWDNPHEIDGDLSKGRLSPTLAEWGLVTEPWTFILDREGVVSARFEGFVTAGELTGALDAVAR